MPRKRLTGQRIRHRRGWSYKTSCPGPTAALDQHRSLVGDVGTAFLLAGPDSERADGAWTLVAAMASLLTSTIKTRAGQSRLCSGSRNRRAPADRGQRAGPPSPARLSRWRMDLRRRSQTRNWTCCWRRRRSTTSAVVGSCPDRISAALSDSPVPDLYLGQAVSSAGRETLASRARYAGIAARERPLRH